MAAKKTEAQVRRELEDLRAQRGVYWSPEFTRFREMVEAERNRIVQKDMKTVEPSDAGAVGRIQGKLMMLDWFTGEGDRILRQIEKLESRLPGAQSKRKGAATS